jgi:tetratricopeptide (TPR) repeat protein
LSTDREADPAELVALVERATPVFEQLGDDRSLGRAWRNLGYVRGSMEGRCADWLDASEKAVTYYRRSGWSASGCLMALAAALFYGPTPVARGMVRCEQLLDETTDRLGTAHVLVYLAGLNALAERFEESFTLLAEAQAIYRDLGELYVLADNHCRISGRVHLLADDPPAAEQAFRECCETLVQARDEAATSTVAAGLGEALYRQRRYAEADSWGRFAEEHAPAGDIIAQFSWRALRGKLLAREGRIEEGEAVGSEAVVIADRTDTLTHRGEVLLNLAQVLSAGERHAEAAKRIEQALAHFESKGDEASARSARSLLAAVVVV